MMSQQLCPLDEPLWNVPTGLTMYSPGLSPAGRRPVAIRPTLPMGFNNVGSFYPSHLPPRAVVAGVVHVHSPPPAGLVLDNSTSLFKDAAWNNGINIRSSPKGGQYANTEANAEDFEKFAKRNGIKIGKSEERDDTDNLDAVDENDTMVINFEEIARRRGIRVGEPTDEANSNPTDCITEPEHSSENSQEASVTKLFETQAKKCGIRVGEPAKVNSNPTDCITEPEHSSENSQESSMAELFETQAKKCGIRVGEPAKVNSNPTDCITEPEHSSENSQEASITELFEIQAMKCGIRVGEPAKVNNNPTDCITEPEHSSENYQEASITELFEIQAMKCGIRVGEQTELANSNPMDYITEPEHSSEDSQETSVTQLFEIQAEKCGIRLGEERETLLSCANTSSASHKDEVCNEDHVQEITSKAEMASEETVPVIAAMSNQDIKDESEASHDTEKGELFDFEELARRHGIKIGKGSQEFIPSGTQPSIGNMQLITFQKRASKHGIQVIRPIVADVSTQTFSESLFYVVHSTQTSHTDLGIEYSNSAVQVDVVPEAFEEEFTSWKLDEGDAEEMSYKSLYFAEHSEKTELEKRLESEMDLSVRTQRNHKQVMEGMKKEVNDMEDKVEKLKKEVKTVKKHKETEIKRLTKEKKQQEEDMEALTNKLKLKDVALETLREVLENETTHVKELEAKVKQLSERSPVQHCEKCHQQQSADQRSSSPGLSTKGQTDSNSDTDSAAVSNADKWRVYTPGCKKPSLVTAAPLQNSLTKTSKMSELSEFDLPKNAGIARLKDLSKAAGNNGCASSESGMLLNQECSARKSSSSYPPDRHSPTWLKETERTGKMDKLSDIGISEEVQGRWSFDRLVAGTGSVSGIDNIPTNGHLYQDDSGSKRKMSSGNESHNTGLPPGLEEHIQSPKLSFQTGEQWASQSSSTDQQFSDVPFETSSTGTSEKSYFSDANQESEMPANLEPEMPSSAASVLVQPSPYLPGVNSQNLYRYLSALINNPTNQDEDKGGVANVPPPPPGINTIPVPMEMPVSSAQGGACKFGTFDKLMSALKKRFPEHSRSDLIMYLKKAKADCGPTGFRGKQISEVVEHVANAMTPKP